MVSAFLHGTQRGVGMVHPEEEPMALGTLKVLQVWEHCSLCYGQDIFPVSFSRTLQNNGAGSRLPKLSRLGGQPAKP